jgi:hypothetical protein
MASESVWTDLGAVGCVDGLVSTPNLLRQFEASSTVAMDMRKEGKRGRGTAMVATQSRFHRDRLDGEPTVSKALRFDLVLNFQWATYRPCAGRAMTGKLLGV